jgi:hypothetical protein
MRQLGQYEVMGVVAVIAAVGIVYYLKKGASAVLDVAATSLNPVSDQNLANIAANSIGGALTNQTTASGGTRPFSLGTWLYETTHPGAAAPSNTTTGAPIRAAGTAGSFTYAGKSYKNYVYGFA